MHLFPPNLSLIYQFFYLLFSRGSKFLNHLNIVENKKKDVHFNEPSFLREIGLVHIFLNTHLIATITNKSFTLK
ncbi:hypothetical protein ES703_76667 [subsurface metagenome]